MISGIKTLTLRSLAAFWPGILAQAGAIEGWIPKSLSFLFFTKILFVKMPIGPFILWRMWRSYWGIFLRAYVSHRCRMGPRYKSILSPILCLLLTLFLEVVSDLSKQPFLRGVAIDGYPLRPELVESVYHLYSVTRDPSLLKIALRAQQALRMTRVTCGFCSVHGVLNQQHVLLDQVRRKKAPCGFSVLSQLSSTSSSDGQFRCERDVQISVLVVGSGE